MGLAKSLGLGAVAFLAGLSYLGQNIQKDSDTGSPPLDDMRSAIRMNLKNAEIGELHYLASQNAVCGLVKHDASQVGRAPFAYSHQLGLTVASKWGGGEPEQLNKLYGCSFLPIAYVEEWKLPFWGGERGTFYRSAFETL